MQNAHDHTNGIDKAEIVALLTYTLQHNQHHEHDLLNMQQQLRSLGLMETAEQLGQCIADYDRGNTRMAALVAANRE